MVKAAPCLTPDALKRLFHYDPISGKIYREVFTSTDGQGYLLGHYQGKMLKAHRVAWAIAHGEWPERHIDHIDGDVTNNRIENLRLVDNLENNRNQRLPKNNTSGIIGVSWNKKTGKWTAQIKVNRRTVHLGSFPNIEEAAKARKFAESRLGFHENHGRAA